MPRRPGAPSQSRSTDLWTVTLAPDRDVAGAVQALKRAGLEVVDVLDVIGVVTGHADAAAVARLRKVDGVTDVSRTPRADVGPPDAPVS